MLGSQSANVTSTIIPIGVRTWPSSTRQYWRRSGNQTSRRTASISGRAIITLPKTSHGTAIPVKTAISLAVGGMALIVIDDFSIVNVGCYPWRPESGNV
jgi:hypothetical protein